MWFDPTESRWVRVDAFLERLLYKMHVTGRTARPVVDLKPKINHRFADFIRSAGALGAGGSNGKEARRTVALNVKLVLERWER